MKEIESNKEVKQIKYECEQCGKTHAYTHEIMKCSVCGKEICDVCRTTYTVPKLRIDNRSTDSEGYSKFLTYSDYTFVKAESTLDLFEKAYKTTEYEFQLCPKCKEELEQNFNIINYQYINLINEFNEKAKSIENNLSEKIVNYLKE